MTLSRPTAYRIERAVDTGACMYLRNILDKDTGITTRPDLLTDYLSKAINEKKPDMARALLDHGADANRHDAEGVSPATHAVWNGSVDLYNLLIAYGFDIGSSISENPQTNPLTELAETSNPDLYDAVIPHQEPDTYAEADWLQALIQVLHKAVIAMNAPLYTRLAEHAAAQSRADPKFFGAFVGGCIPETSPETLRHLDQIFRSGIDLDDPKQEAEAIEPLRYAVETYISARETGRDDDLLAVKRKIDALIGNDATGRRPFVGGTKMPALMTARNPLAGDLLERFLQAYPQALTCQTTRRELMTQALDRENESAFRTLTTWGVEPEEGELKVSPSSFEETSFRETFQCHLETRIPASTTEMNDDAAPAVGPTRF